MPAITVSTIGDLIDRHYSLTAWCQKCGNREVDLEKLAAKYGRDASYIVGETPIKIVCAECRAGPLRYVISAR